MITPLTSAPHMNFSGKGIGAPLAFSCIKSAGGKVPRTLVGITRIYPVLYKERLVLVAFCLFLVLQSLYNQCV